MQRWSRRKERFRGSGLAWGPVPPGCSGRTLTVPAGRRAGDACRQRGRRWAQDSDFLEAHLQLSGATEPRRCSVCLFTALPMRRGVNGRPPPSPTALHTLAVWSPGMSAHLASCRAHPPFPRPLPICPGPRPPHPGSLPTSPGRMSQIPPRPARALPFLASLTLGSVSLFLFSF